MSNVVQMGQRRANGTRVRLCTPIRWRLEPVEGRPRRYLVTLWCADEHLHHAAVLDSYQAARAEMRRWQRDTLGEQHPGLLIEDHLRGRMIRADGCEWPLASSN